MMPLIGLARRRFNSELGEWNWASTASEQSASLSDSPEGRAAAKFTTSCCRPLSGHAYASGSCKRAGVLGLKFGLP